MMNIDNRILMETIETQTRQDLSEQIRARYPDDYCDVPAEETTPLHPATACVSLQPDELALHEKLLEIAHTRPAAPSESFFG